MNQSKHSNFKFKPIRTVISNMNQSEHNLKYSEKQFITELVYNLSKRILLTKLDKNWTISNIIQEPKSDKRTPLLSYG